jgi:hypothetical protein
MLQSQQTELPQLKQQKSQHPAANQHCQSFHMAAYSLAYGLARSREHGDELHKLMGRYSFVQRYTKGPVWKLAQIDALGGSLFAKGLVVLLDDRVAGTHTLLDDVRVGTFHLDCVKEQPRLDLVAFVLDS